MTTKQQEIYDQRLMQYGAHKTLTPGVQSLLYTLACVEAEEQTLQEYCDNNGTCYQVIGRSGDTYSKQRPEWQQLKEARMRKQAIIAKLESWAGDAQPEDDDVSDYFK
jgi:hypothetical protein